MENYPAILGADVSGQVYKVGERITHVKAGDRVIGLCTLCNALVVAKIPDNFSYNSAAVLPLAISTASTLSFKDETLSLPPPTSSSESHSTGKSVLIWGASGSVGATAIQLATTAGVKVITVSSPHIFENLKRLGAVAVFDHHFPTAAKDIIAALVGTDFAGICDTVGSPEAAAMWAPVYAKLGDRYRSVKPGAQGLPEGIEGESVFGATVALADRYVSEAVWRNWVAGALEMGVLMALPEPLMIRGGLEAMLGGLEEQRKEVSFGKVIVEL